MSALGEFYIEIFYDNVQIDNSPFISRSFDIDKIKIEHFPLSTIVGSSTYFISKFYLFFISKIFLFLFYFCI